jgi:hypothetical protein
MVRKKMQRLAAAGTAVLGLGAWGLVSAVNANAAEAGCWTRSFSTYNAFYAHVEWCGNGDPRGFVDVKSRTCTQPSGYPPCTFKESGYESLIEARWFYGPGEEFAMVQAVLYADGNADQTVPA